jgi:hypothetical protein
MTNERSYAGDLFEHTGLFSLRLPLKIFRTKKYTPLYFRKLHLFLLKHLDMLEIYSVALLDSGTSTPQR